jgi:hypothetical protein
MDRIVNVNREVENRDRKEERRQSGPSQDQLHNLQCKIKIVGLLAQKFRVLKDGSREGRRAFLSLGSPADARPRTLMWILLWDICLLRRNGFPCFLMACATDTVDSMGMGQALEGPS